MSGDRSVREAIEYTDFRKTISERDIETMCAEAVAYGFGAVIVPSAVVSWAEKSLSPSRSRVAIGTVISYPFGSQSATVKATEAETALAAGATRLDIIPHFGTIAAERWDHVRGELAAIREAASRAELKLVLEVSRLTPQQIREVSAIAADLGYTHVSNTVGFRIVSTDPTESVASKEAVTSLQQLAGEQLRIKAAGGITTAGTVEDLCAAGADRIALAVAPGRLREMGWIAKPEGGSGE
jgi:deoxyribose-phosphate aldolase